MASENEVAPENLSTVSVILHILGNKCTCFTRGQDHELLHGQLVTSMRTTVDYVKCRNRQNNFRGSRQVSNVSAIKGLLPPQNEMFGFNAHTCKEERL